jgi:hypothetical protein
MDMTNNPTHEIVIKGHIPSIVIMDVKTRDAMLRKISTALSEVNVTVTSVASAEELNPDPMTRPFNGSDK